MEKILILDIIKAIDQFNVIKEIEEKRIEELSALIRIYENLIDKDKIKQAIEIKKQAYQVHKKHITDIYIKKFNIIKEYLDEHLDQKKADYMINGLGLEERYQKVFSRSDSCSRGYLTLHEVHQCHIISEVTTVKDLFDKNIQGITFFEENELDLSLEPRQQRALYKIKADGTIKRIKDNY